jgi:hypothetical protein
VDPELARRPPGLAVLMGKVDSAYELYVGGRLLGGAGALPPAAHMDYDRHRLFVVPADAVSPDGELVLALRVWKSPETESGVGGPVEGNFRVGPALLMQRQSLLTELPALLLGGLYVLVGLYHLQLFSRRPTSRDYLWFAAVAMDAGIYSLLRTQAKYALGVGFGPLKELEYLVLMLLPVLFAQFVWPFVGERIPRGVRLHQIWSAGLGIAVASTPGLWLNAHALPVWELSLLPLLAAVASMLGRRVRSRHPEALGVAAGLAIFVVCGLHDIAIDRGFVDNPRAAHLGFAALVVSMAISLGNRFSILSPPGVNFTAFDKRL